MYSATAVREIFMVSNPRTLAKNVGTTSLMVTLSLLGSPGTPAGITATSVRVSS
jgi:hypothetical protein